MSLAWSSLNKGTKEERAGLGSARALPNPCSQKTAAARKCHQEPRVIFPHKSGRGGADLTTNIVVQKTWRSCRGNKINREAGSIREETEGKSVERDWKIRQPQKSRV